MNFTARHALNAANLVLVHVGDGVSGVGLASRAERLDFAAPQRLGIAAMKQLLFAWLLLLLACTPTPSGMIELPKTGPVDQAPEPPRFSKMAISKATRLGSSPIVVRRGMGRQDCETSA